MKYILSLCCAVISAFIIISFLPVNGEETLYDNVIRLHVIADSDSEEDQAIKLRVRDRIIAEIGDRGGDSKRRTRRYRRCFRKSNKPRRTR